MGWDKQSNGKLYYYRARWDGTKVVKEYVGTGAVGEQAALADAEARLERNAAKQTWQRMWAAMDTAQQPLNEVCNAAHQLARMALILAGFYQHNRREWRRRRET
jgi:hypothetical protein